MAKEETNILQQIRLTTSKAGITLFRNNRGMFYLKHSVDKILKDILYKVLKGDFKDVLDMARQKPLSTRAGLEANGSSDLIGWTPVIVTQEMVGKPVAIFTAIEVKTFAGRASSDQVNFIDGVNKCGGIGVIANNHETVLLNFIGYEIADRKKLLTGEYESP